MAYLSSWKWLSQFGPGFSLPGTTIKVLKQPENFYSVLIERAKSATKRISLASLYIGNGKLETQLLGVLQKNLEDNSALKVKVLLDFSRGNRGAETSSRRLLLPLLQSSNSCEVFLYHTPSLRGLAKKCLPQRWNEIVGLQHMKIYVFDDSVLITGANLSNDYFTNRQDRYVLVEDCAPLANFYDGLITQVSTFSFQLESNNNLRLSSNWKFHPVNGDQAEFINAANTIITTYYDNYFVEHGITSVQNQMTQQKITAGGVESRVTSTTPVNDTWVFPLIQMGPLGINMDNLATSRIFEETAETFNIKLATGYFNLTSEYVDKIVQRSRADFDILMAHPKANGFLGAGGAAGGIPAAYTLVAKMFLDKIRQSNQQKRIAIWEYLRPGWTFHAKGLWLYPSRTQLPVATLIGSPNFGHRSVYRDLETQLYIVTGNPSLQQQLHEEQERLFANCKPFDDRALAQADRVVPLWVKLVVRFFRNFF